MKKPIIMLIGCSVVLLVLLLMVRAVTPMTKVPLARTLAIDLPKKETKIDAIDFLHDLKSEDRISNQNKKEVSRSSHFKSHFKEFKEAILENSSFISIKKRSEGFQKTAYDTRENFVAAKNLLLNPYPSVLEEDFVTKRVTALSFLGLTSQLQQDDCMLLLDEIEHQFLTAKDKSHLQAVQFDMGSLAYVCAEKGDALFQNKINLLPHPALKAQALNAMRTYHEEAKT